MTNLTPPSLHVEVTEACLRSSRHVYSEKPLALSFDDAIGLVRLAQEMNVRLGCSPSVWLAPAQQAAWREVASGILGDIRLVYAEVNQGRVESWHPAPQNFYDVGPLFDAGVYPIAYLTAVFGPVRRVTAYASMLKGDRVTTEGVHFAPGSEDLVIAILETAEGVTVRLTCNFYVSNDMSQRGIEFHGDKGSLQLDSWFEPNAGVRVAAFGEGYQDVPLGAEPAPEVEWARGVQDMARAISEERAHLASGEHAAHVVEILNGILQAAREQRPVRVVSDFPKPQPRG